MRIRPETPGDRARIRQLLISAFAGEGESDLVDELHSPDLVVAACVGEHDGAIAGYVLFSTIEVEVGGLRVPSAALAPLAVRADCRNQGLGAALVGDGLEVCRKRGVDLVAVVGDPAYYGRIGFSRVLAEGLASPFSGPAMQLLELRPGARGTGPGTLAYPHPFDRFC